MTHVPVIALLGGPTVLGPAVTTDLAFIALVERGLPGAAFGAFRDQLSDAGMRSTDAADALLASLGALDVAHARGSQLSPAVSDCLARLARLVIRTAEVLGSRAGALAWLTTSNRALDGLSPARLVSTDAGVILVEEVLGRVEHGVFS